MKYKYLTIIKLNGVVQPNNFEEQILIEYPAINAKATLTYNISNHITELAKITAIGNHLLVGSLNPTTNQTFEECLELELKRIKEKQIDEIDKGVFIVFEALGEDKSTLSEHIKKMPNFIISFDDNQSKEPIGNQYKTIIDGIISSFALGSDQLYSFKKIQDGTIFTSEDGTPVYKYNFEMSGTVTHSTCLTPELITYVKRNAKTLGKHQSLINSSRLLSKSLNENSDNLQSFLSTWAGLEIFVHKNFKKFETIAFGKMNDSSSPNAPSQFFSRIKTVMKDKYRVSDKFSIISLELSGESASDDIQIFDEIKGIRDKLMHGHDVNINTLPIFETQKLLRKYLKLYSKWLQKIKTSNQIST